MRMVVIGIPFSFWTLCVLRKSSFQKAKRVIDIADYIIDNNATVRKAAKQFGVSKSTAHKDVTTRLLEIDPQLAAKVRKILDINKQERHIRGGLATKEKYSHMTR